MLEGHSRKNFSIRQMLVVMFFLALFSFLAAAAYAGDPMAYGLVIATFGLVVPICCMAIMSGIAILLSHADTNFLKKAASSTQSGELADGRKVEVSPCPEVINRENSENGSEVIE
ncbi:MAG: hypothetical protein ACR2NK_10285 [Mariniblastus sp.]